MKRRLSLITGATSGIGLATAHRLRRCGDAVVLVGTDGDALASAVAALGGGEFAQAIVLDVADHAAVVAAISALPPLDTVVLSAGVCRQAAVDDPEGDATWFSVVGVNLHGVYSVIRAAVPRMGAGGRIVAISSGLGKLGRPGYSAYAAAKHGVLGLVKCVAKELAPRGITVNAVCPGWVDTKMAHADVEKTARANGVTVDVTQAQIAAAIPIGRMVEADEVAALVEFLASPSAAAITGEAYNISGGEFFA